MRRHVQIDSLASEHMQFTDCIAKALEVWQVRVKIKSRHALEQP